jgi:hypothetical protein
VTRPPDDDDVLTVAAMSSYEDPKEKARRRLAAMRAKEDMAEPMPAAQPKASPSKPSSSSGTPAPGAAAEDQNREMTHEEKRDMALAMLKENEEMKKAFVSSYYLIQGSLAAFAGWLLAAHMEKPFGAEASHLAALNNPGGMRDVEVTVAIGFILAAMLLSALAAFTQIKAVLRASAVMCLFPTLRVLGAYFSHPELWSVSLALLWVPFASPVVVGIQWVVWGMMDEMDTNVVEYYRKITGGVGGEGGEGVLEGKGQGHGKGGKDKDRGRAGKLKK